MTVAVAYSRTPEGSAAVAAAADMADRLGEDLAVLSVVPDDPEGPEGETGDRGARDEVERMLAGATLTWELHLVAAGHDVPQALLDLVGEVGASLLVVGSKRRSPVGKLLLGSVVQRVILDSNVPVLTVKPPR